MVPWSWLYIKMLSYQYRKSHWGDKTILQPSYLHNGISYTGKTASLYWISPQVITWTNDDVSSIGSLGTNNKNICIKIQYFTHENSFQNGVCKMLAILFRSQCFKPFSRSHVSPFGIKVVDTCFCQLQWSGNFVKQETHSIYWSLHQR